MTILEVQNLKKTYTTRFGGAQVEALKKRYFFSGGGRVRRDHGRILIR